MKVRILVFVIMYGKIPIISPPENKPTRSPDNKPSRIRAHGLLALAVILMLSCFYCQAQPILKRKTPSNNKPLRK